MSWGQSQQDRYRAEQARQKQLQMQQTQLNIQRVNAWNLAKQRKAAEKVARLAEQEHQQVAHQNRLLAKWQDRLAEQELMERMTDEQKAEYLAEREQERWENSFVGQTVAFFRTLFTFALGLIGFGLIFFVIFIIGTLIENNWS